jgi:hypothetical protein
MTITEWLQESPAPEEIALNAEGNQFIPIGIIENKLRQLCGQWWNTKNFSFSLFQHSTTVMVSASIEVELSFDNTNKTLVGAVTFTDFEYGSNLDWAATAKSEAIKNAVKGLGPQFGANLNGRADIKQGSKNNGKEALKLKPDIKIIKRYNDAIIEKNTEEITRLISMYDIKTV